MWVYVYEFSSEYCFVDLCLLSYVFILFNPSCMTYWLFGRKLFNFHAFENFPIFLLLLLSSLVLQRLKKDLDTIPALGVCLNFFYVTVIKYPSESHLREKGFGLESQFQMAVHPAREVKMAGAAGCWPHHTHS